jgi:hypothetical protein
MIRRTPKRRPDVVADVRHQVEQAAALAAIGDQDRLTDPYLNPATRGQADELRTDELARLLADRHRRTVRRLRVTDRRADAAERTLVLIQQAREATSPAHSVLALHQGRSRAMAAAMTASVALMAGAATGVAALAEDLDLHGGAGWVAEIGMTGLSTAAILVRSHLARHGYQVTGWQSKSLWALAIVPMLCSVAANAVAAGPIGIACSIGAAAFATLAHLIAETYGEAIVARAGEVTRDDEAELYAAALGEDPRRTVSPAAEAEDEAPALERPAVPELRAEDAVQAYADTMVAAIEQWLDDGPDGGTGAVPVVPDAPAPSGAAVRQDEPEDGAGDEGAHIVVVQDGEGAHIESDQDARPVRSGSGSGAHVERAHAARRQIGDVTRRRIRKYLAENPGATTRQIVRDLRISPATVRRWRPKSGPQSGEVT